MRPSVLAFVMAGGEGTRLDPLTRVLPKPALPFGGCNRLIDFVLSNLYNSHVRAVYVLLQYRPQILLDYIAANWAGSPGKADEFVRPVLPWLTPARAPFRGTAHAVHQCLHLIEEHAPDLVAVFAADHVYRMDVRQMIRFHEERAADATVAAVPVPVKYASSFGIIEADERDQIRRFQEKPREPARLPHVPDAVYASMGNYLFTPGVLVRALRDACERGEVDFGRHVLPRLILTRRVLAYDFSRNMVPGVSACEDPGYWRDVGTVDAYVLTHRDLLGRKPRFKVENRQWPIFCGDRRGAPQSHAGNGRTRNSIVGPGAVATKAALRKSIVQRGAYVEPGAELADCIIMEGVRVRRGARLRQTLVSGPNTIAEGESIGHDLKFDRQRYGTTPAGVIVVPPRPEY
ncbi:MAG: NTP transferase domain-containing protein [Betaproteobacteria bacterium]|nr:NTP transferase domain-containing protein [Betaproteobacteria bacterium]